MRKPVGAMLVLLVLGCAKTPQEQLAEQGQTLTPDSFVIAIDASDQLLVELFIAAGIDVDRHDSNGVPPLSHALQLDDSSVALVLFHAGAQPDTVVANAGMSALMLASMRDARATVVALIDAGATIDRQDNYGNTALFNAAAEGRPAPEEALNLAP